MTAEQLKKAKELQLKIESVEKEINLIDKLKKRKDLTIHSPSYTCSSIFIGNQKESILSLLQDEKEKELKNLKKAFKEL